MGGYVLAVILKGFLERDLRRTFGKIQTIREILRRARFRSTCFDDLMVCWRKSFLAKSSFSRAAMAGIV